LGGVLLFKKMVVLDSVIFYPEHRERLDTMAAQVVEYNTCSSEDEVSVRCAGADAIISCWVDIPNRIVDENPQLKAIRFWTDPTRWLPKQSNNSWKCCS
jgi:cupin superfamily acireductone dioxygenase involved in methionine salvage